MIQQYNWGDTIGSITVKFIIQKNIEELEKLVIELEKHGFNFVAFNTKGIIVSEKKEIRDEIVYSSLSTLGNRIDRHKTNLDYTIEEVKLMAAKIVDIKESLKNSFSSKDITNEFFVLYDFLPEHIQKEIKIYIKAK